MQTALSSIRNDDHTLLHFDQFFFASDRRLNTRIADFFFI